MEVTKHEVGDYIEIENRIFQIVLRPKGNGIKTWLYPCLIVAVPEPKKEYLTYKTKVIKKIVDGSIKDIILTKKDRPIEEEFSGGDN